MTLPEGATCGQCIHIQRCNGIFGHVASDTTCDWFPRLFVTYKPIAVDDAKRIEVQK